MPDTAPTATNHVQFRLALAIPLGRGQAYLGWTDDPDASLRSLTLYDDDGNSSRLALDTSPAILIRTPRPREPGSTDTRQAGGFAIWLPAAAQKGSQPLVTLNDQAADATKVPVFEPAKAMAHADLLEAYGTTLAALARSQRDSGLLKLLAKPLADLATRRGNAFGAIEQAWRIAGHLLVIARVACEPERVTGIRYQCGRASPQDITSHVHRFPLPTHKGSHGRPVPGHVCGLCFVLPLAELPRGDQPSLQLSIAKLGELDLPLRPLESQLDALPDILVARPQVVPVVLQALQKQVRGAAERRQLAVLARQCFDRLWSRSGQFDAYAEVCAVGIPGAFALGNEGIAIFGFLARPEGAPVRIYLHAEENMPIDVTRHAIFLPMDGDLTSVTEKFPAAGRNLSFFAHLPIATAGGERRLLRVVMPGVPDIWVRIETRALQEQGHALVLAMLGHLPRSAWLARYFADVCARGLGKVLQLAALQRPSSGTEPRVQQLGRPVPKPWVTVIVPLSTGSDALRHQLAAFGDDPDFASGVDLVYVCDYPEHEVATLKLAEQCQPLFQVPLRVLSYGPTRGFAGACNAAAAMARAPLLLLMDASLVPQQVGWLKALCRGADKLPGFGMAAPVLEHGDGSLKYPNSGLAWDGGNKPSEQEVLSAPCLLVRKRDFDAMGGFDAGYFGSEGAAGDLSSRMRAASKRLYLVPTVRLWHLDGTTMATKKYERRLLGLYDAWRYRNSEAAGVLRKPRARKAS